MLYTFKVYQLNKGSTSINHCDIMLYIHTEFTSKTKDLPVLLVTVLECYIHAEFTI